MNNSQPSDAEISWISGPVLRATTRVSFHLNEAVRVGEDIRGASPSGPVMAVRDPAAVGAVRVGLVVDGVAVLLPAQRAVDLDSVAAEVGDGHRADDGRLQGAGHVLLLLRGGWK